MLSCIKTTIARVGYSSKSTFDDVVVFFEHISKVVDAELFTRFEELWSTKEIQLL